MIPGLISDFSFRVSGINEPIHDVVVGNLLSDVRSSPPGSDVIISATTIIVELRRRMGEGILPPAGVSPFEFLLVSSTIFVRRSGR